MEISGPGAVRRVQVGMLGDVIRRAREERGLTQAEFAEAVGVHLNTAGAWERTGRVPARRLPAIAQILQLDVADLRAAAKAPPAAAPPPPDSPYVESWDDLRRWQKRMSNSEMNPDLKLMLAMLGVEVQEGPWIVPVKVGRFIAEKHLGRELVERAWPQLLDSPWVERVGDVEYVFRLRFPQN